MDISQLLARPHDMNVGEAARYIESFAAEMASAGYSPLTISGYLDSVTHFGGWLQGRGLSLTAIDEKIVKAFGAHRCECPGRRSYPSVSRLCRTSRTVCPVSRSARSHSIDRELSSRGPIVSDRLPRMALAASGIGAGNR